MEKRKKKSEGLRNPLSPRLFSEDGSEKKMLLCEEIFRFGDGVLDWSRN